jgi:glycosyltransferase involved in cell wall biosynthesis
VLLDMLRSPFSQPFLAVPAPGALADRAAALGVPVRFYDLGEVQSVRRPLRAATAWRVSRDAFRIARQIADLLRETEAAFVHANGLKVHVGACLARLLHGTPTVVHMHDVPFSRSERLIWRGLASAASHVIAASTICFPDQIQRSAHASLLRQGLQAEVAPEPRALPPEPVVGYLGRFHPFKGTHLLLDWFESIADEFPTATLLLRGRADPEGAAYWAGLQPRINRLVARGRCRVDSWRADGSDPFDGIDILVAPSVHPEVGPRVIMEAMVRGIPAIGYPAGGALEMMPHPGVGAHAADTGQFREALQRLLDPATYASVSASALEHARRSFGIERFWADLACAHSAALSTRTPPGRPEVGSWPTSVLAPWSSDRR